MRKNRYVRLVAKTCTRCGDLLGAERFDMSQTAALGGSRCFSCMNARRIEIHGVEAIRAEIREDGRNRTVARAAIGLPATVAQQHGLGDEEYLALVRKNRCGLCSTNGPNTPHGRWCVDHDHAHCPGRIGCRDCVRDILCQPCNTMLGLVEKAMASGLIALDWSPVAAYLSRRWAMRVLR